MMREVGVMGQLVMAGAAHRVGGRGVRKEEREERREDREERRARKLACFSAGNEHLNALSTSGDLICGKNIIPGEPLPWRLDDCHNRGRK